jgi:hypothetical protein
MRLGQGDQGLSGVETIWSRVLALRPEAQELADLVFAHVASARRVTVDELRADGPRSETYFVRYVLTLAELAGWPSRPPLSISRELAAHFEWCWAWRRLDDILDASPNAEGIAALVKSLMRATGALIRLMDESHEVEWREVEELLEQTCRVVVRERMEGVGREDIWRRASPFLIIPRTVLKLAEGQDLLYRKLLGLLGLEHDIHDLFDDMRRGFRTEPARWLREIDPYETFRPDVLRSWFTHAASQLEKESKQLELDIGGQDLPVFGVILSEASEIIRELRGF